MNRTRSPHRCSTVDVRNQPPPDAFRVPVERRDVTLLFDDGSRRDVRLPMALGSAIEEVFEAAEPFLPVEDGGVFRIYARASLAAIFVPQKHSSEDDSMPRAHRALRVCMKSGVVLEGTLSFVKIEGRGRITDVLNESAASFALHLDEGESHLAKSHVLWVEER